MMVRSPTLLFAASLVLAACGEGGVSNAGSPPEIVGRIERGNTVQVLLHDPSGASVANPTVTITPASAGVVTGSTIALTQTGSATITASAGARVTSVSVTIATPPTIYFDAVDQGNRDIYSAALDGQGVQRLTTDPSDDQEPTVAKGTLVFASARSGSFDLFAMPAAGGTETRLTTLAGSETQPSLSADGTRLVYTGDASGIARLYLASSTATGAALLTSAAFGGGSAIEVNGKWTTSGDKLVFAATANGRANLFTAASSAGATPAGVTGSTAQFTDVEPYSSPDATRIVFASTRAGGTSLFVADTRNGAVTQLTFSDVTGQPVWLADGRIVFTRFSGNTSALAWIDPDAISTGVHEIPVPYSKPQHPAVVR